MLARSPGIESLGALAIPGDRKPGPQLLFHPSRHALEHLTVRGMSSVEAPLCLRSRASWVIFAGVVLSTAIRSVRTCTVVDTVNQPFFGNVPHALRLCPNVKRSPRGSPMRYIFFTPPASDNQQFVENITQ